MLTVLATLVAISPAPPAPWGSGGDKVTIKVTTPEELRSLHSLVMREGVMKAGDAGSLENGPDFWYEGHQLGKRLIARRDCPESVWFIDHSVVYTDGRNLSDLKKSIETFLC